MIDDLEEIKLEPDRSGKAGRIRSGKKRGAVAVDCANHKARWIRQLRRYNMSKKRPKP